MSLSRVFLLFKKKKTTSGTGGGEGSFNKRSSARKYPSNHLALRWMERIYTASSDCNRAVLVASLDEQIKNSLPPSRFHGTLLLSSLKVWFRDVFVTNHSVQASFTFIVPSTRQLCTETYPIYDPSKMRAFGRGMRVTSSKVRPLSSFSLPLYISLNFSFLIRCFASHSGQIDYSKLFSATKGVQWR